MEDIPYGYCKCGCGHRTKIATRSRTKWGWVKGEPLNFIHGHSQKGELSWKWNGGRKVNPKGYTYILAKGHPFAPPDGYVGEHILFAEDVLGKYLPPKAVVHHIDGDPSNNIKENLVVCQDQEYHMLLHVREEALKACGNANWRKCKHCGIYDDMENLSKTDRWHYHKSCAAEYQRSRRIF